MYDTISLCAFSLMIYQLLMRRRIRNILASLNAVDDPSATYATAESAAMSQATNFAAQNPELAARAFSQTASYATSNVQEAKQRQAVDENPWA